MGASRFAALALLVAGLACAGNAPPLTLDHAWIVVTTGAPERTVLEKAGFRIAPSINRHEGQGTASVTIEFLNAFLEASPAVNADESFRHLTAS